MSEQSRSELTITGYPFGDVPDDVLADVADLFREIFCNAPYDQFAAHEGDPTRALSFSNLAPEGFTASQDYFSLETLDRAQLPDGVFRWMDPAEFNKRFLAKAEQLYVSTAFDLELNKHQAFSIGRILSVRELYETEEIRNPVYYSGREFFDTLRDEAAFFRLMDFHFGLEPDDEIFFALGYGAHPSIRGRNYLAGLMNALADHVMPQHAVLPAMAEIPEAGAGRVFSEAVHERVVHGLLGNNHAVVYARTLQSVIDIYRQGSRHLMRLARDRARVHKRQFAPHPSDHPGVEIKNLDSKGEGVVAKQAIQRGELIAEFIGETYTAARESELPSIMVDRCIQTGPETYIFAEHRLAEKINHSCDPNCGVRERTKIVAIKPIAEGEELSWDYRMSENSDWVLENCLCGAVRCSKRIEGYDSLPEEIRQEYLAKGAVSSWLLDRA